jgi:hypothetical protein
VIAALLKVARETQSIAADSFDIPGLMHRAIQLLGIKQHELLCSAMAAYNRKCMYCQVFLSYWLNFMISKKFGSFVRFEI